MEFIFDVKKYYIVNALDEYVVRATSDEAIGTYTINAVAYKSMGSSIPTNLMVVNAEIIDDTTIDLHFRWLGDAEMTTDTNYYIQLFASNNTITLPVGSIDVVVVAENEYPENESIVLPQNGGKFTYHLCMPTTFDLDATDWSVELLTMQSNVVINNIYKAPTFIAFDVIASQNYSYQNNTCNIQITKYMDSDITPTQTYIYTFYQNTSTNWVRCTPSPIRLTENGGKIEFTATTNFNAINYTVSFAGDNNQWGTATLLSLTQRQAVGIFQADKNTTTNNRTGKLTITADNYTTVVQVIQDGIQIEDGKINVKNAEVIYKAGTYVLQYVPFNIENDTVTASVTSGEDWLTVSNIFDTNLDYTVSTNNSIQKRTGVIRLSATDIKGNTVTTDVIITQLAFNANPICKDTFFELTTTAENTSYNYSIKIGNKTIYNGIVYTVPNTNLIKININKIVYNYLNSSLPTFFKVENNNFLNEIKDYYLKFDLYIDDVFKDEFYFYNDYSYNFTPLSEKANADNTVVLSEPINNKIDRRQVFLHSLFTPVKEDLPTKIDYADNIHLISSNIVRTTNQWLVMDDNLSLHPNATTLYVNDAEYKIVDTCSEYVFYYINAHGGWDSFLIEGNNKRVDKLTSYNTIKNFDNTKPDFETKKYITIINPTFELSTHYLTNDEASRMYNLLESNEVYLHNLITGDIVPVNISLNTVEYKTFTNNGRKKFLYKINVELAQTRIRI